MKFFTFLHQSLTENTPSSNFKTYSLALSSYIHCAKRMFYLKILSAPNISWLSTSMLSVNTYAKLFFYFFKYRLFWKTGSYLTLYLSEHISSYPFSHRYEFKIPQIPTTTNLNTCFITLPKSPDGSPILMS